jgi:TrmH family RNA methyltransferase
MYYAIPLTQRLRKNVKSLSHKNFRDENSIFLVEGEKLCKELLSSDFVPEVVVIKDMPSQEIVDMLEHFSEKAIPIYTTPKHVFDQMTDAKSPQSIVAVVHKKSMVLDPTLPFIALDGVSDPGNVGTIVRTAEWFGIKQIILGNATADIYNPKVVRSTMGSIFRMNYFETDDLQTLLKKQYSKFKIYGASVKSETNLDKIKVSKNFGLVFGNESHGISEEVAKRLSGDFLIEGFGGAESLNVAVSVGISLYHFTMKK